MNGWNQAVIHLEPKYIEQNLRYLVHMEALALLGFPGEDFAVKCVAPGGGQSGNRSCENLLKAPAPQNFVEVVQGKSMAKVCFFPTPLLPGVVVHKIC